MDLKSICAILMSLSLSPLCFGQSSLHDNDARALCERILTTNLKQWEKEARSSLAKIAPYSIFAIHVADAPALISAGLNLKPEDIEALTFHPLKLSLDGDRLQLELEKWPRFHRALISLRKPEVIQDHGIEHGVVDKMAVKGASRLFFPIREFPHETELGLVMPLRDIADQGHGHVPYFELQLALLKPCLQGGTKNELFVTGENGESLCVDILVEFSTWPENI